MSKSNTFAIKNEQIAGAINLGSLKEKLFKKKEEPEKKEDVTSKAIKSKKGEKEALPKLEKAKKKGEEAPSEKEKKKPVVEKPKAEKKKPLKKEVKENEPLPAIQEAPREKVEHREVAPIVEKAPPLPTKEVLPVVERAPISPEPKVEERKPEPQEKQVPQVVAKPQAPQPAPRPQFSPSRPMGAPQTRSNPQGFGAPRRDSHDKERGSKSRYESSSLIQPVRLQTVSGKPEQRGPQGQKELVRPMLPKEQEIRKPQQPREGGYPPRREGEYQPRREGEYQPRREGEYQPRREGEYQPRREGSYPPREGGYPPRREGGYVPREGGYPPREGGYPPRTGGYVPREGGYPPRTGGYVPREGGYPPRTGGYVPREGGYPPRTGGAPYSGAPRRPGMPYQPGSRPPGARPPFAPRTGPRLPRISEPLPAAGEGEGRRYAEKREESKLREKGKAKDTAPGKGVKRPGEKIFDPRARHGVISSDDDDRVWRGKKKKNAIFAQREEIVRPTKIKIRLPITIKDLAQEMKFKASEIIAKLFIQGQIHTLNDLLTDADVVGLIGHDFGCEVTVDTSEEERIRISGKSAKEEIANEDQSNLIVRPPVVAFMGHVDHGKTSLIDAIRSSNRAAKEVGAITQHIGAFLCSTSHGPITILDTPGHEAFTLMRERGAHITDIVVLVVAGDEGMQEQTIEAIKQAREAKATILVAITKSDKPTFDKELIYRQLADKELLPEAWGGQTVAVPCSAVTKEGIEELLEMIALQSEVLELRANPTQRARGMVIESQMQQGLGAVTTLLVQNGTLRLGDAIVFGSEWGKVKTMRDERGKEVAEASPSMPVLVTGLSGLPPAGDEFIVVKSDKEAKTIAEARRQGKRENAMLKKRPTMENFMEVGDRSMKILNVVLRTDVQGSCEALAKALEKIVSTKACVNIISQGVGQISESDVELASTSKAIILGFHTSVEAHAEQIEKEKGVKILLHDIIYHAVDVIKDEMKALLDKIPLETHKGFAEVKALFKSSQVGIIAGCLVTEGVITRSNTVRIKRGNDIIWTGPVLSLKRVKEDVREVQKGIECGILLSKGPEVAVGDVIEAFEVTYMSQEL